MRGHPNIPAGSAREPRWQGGLELIAELRRQPGITRAEAARRRALSSGSATDIVARLRDLALIDEIAAPTGKRGRPTRALAPHRDGPVVLAIDLRQNRWESAYADIDGTPQAMRSGSTATRPADQMIADLTTAVRHASRRFGRRLRAVSVAVAGTVQNGRIVHSAALGWESVDLGEIDVGGLPLLVGNDATLAGITEARRGAASDTRTSLHLTVEVGIGGILVVDGLPVDGATGAGGEFGHLPFGDPARPCPCGARGCWDIEVDGRALARQLGEPAPHDPYDYAHQVIAAASHDARSRQAVAHVASALGRGVAGLVNAHDPEVVTLGGLGPLLLDAAEAAFERSYRLGLMRFRRQQPPPVVAAAYREEGPIRGAIEVALDLVLSEAGLNLWSSEQAPVSNPRNRTAG